MKQITFDGLPDFASSPFEVGLTQNLETGTIQNLTKVHLKNFVVWKPYMNRMLMK